MGKEESHTATTWLAMAVAYVIADILQIKWEAAVYRVAAIACTMSLPRRYHADYLRLLVYDWNATSGEED